jgi:molecular chaperone GrpE
MGFDAGILDKETLSPEDIESVRARVKELEGLVDEQRGLAGDYIDKLRRTMAEFDNFRKRTAKEKSAMYDDGASDFIEKLIPVLDNFELALSSAADKDDNFYKGVEMIFRQTQAVIADAGVETIEAAGRPFDPNLHNAVAHVSGDSFGENEIIEEIRKGYRFKDRILRHSMVKVAN